jgi:hypothetical protein
MWKRKEPPRISRGLRDTLFGDKPLTEWPPLHAQYAHLEPWASFVAARAALNTKNRAEAVRIWQRITEMPNLESRHYLQAWHFLRQEQVQPSAEQSVVVYGMVMEVPMATNGLDLLAAYADGTTRYYNYSGAGVVWERPDTSLDAEVNAFLEVGRLGATMVGVWEGPRPPAPPPNQARISMLTPGGLRFGQGSLAGLTAEPSGLGKLLVNAGTALMVRLTKVSDEIQRRAGPAPK